MSKSGSLFVSRETLRNGLNGCILLLFGHLWILSQLCHLLEFSNMKEMHSRITAMLGQLGGGDRSVVDALLPLIYEHLKKVAHNQLRQERSGHTLNTTALVHEAYIKLVDQDGTAWKNRAHFLAIAARAMRRILLDYARSRLAEKRGGGQPLATFNDEMYQQLTQPEDLIALDEALVLLATIDKRHSQIVEYHFFGGLTHEEIGEVLSVSISTVRRDWRLARAWLGRQMGKK